jgi:hypothetical protein
MAESVQQATLRRAVKLAGDAHTLGRKLGLGSSSILAMASGDEQVPGWVFLRAADYINEQQESQAHPFVGHDACEEPKTPR